MSSFQIWYLLQVSKKLARGQKRAEKASNFEKIQLGEQHMLPSRRRLFQGRPCVFQQGNAKPHTAAITTAWLCSRRVRVLNWPACSPDLSPIENIWCIIKRKIKDDYELFSSWKPIRQEWDPTPKLQKLITSMPRRLQTVLKRGGDATPMVTCPRPNYFETCSRHQIWNELILCIAFLQFLSLNICYVIYVLLWIKYVIWNYFSFFLFKFKKNVPTFPEFGLY